MAQMCSSLPKWNKTLILLLKAQGGNAEGDARCKLGKEDVEGVEDGLVTARARVLHLEVINHIREHGPVGRGRDLCSLAWAQPEKPHRHTSIVSQSRLQLTMARGMQQPHWHQRRRSTRTSQWGCSSPRPAGSWKEWLTRWEQNKIQGRLYPEFPSVNPRLCCACKILTMECELRFDLVTAIFTGWGYHRCQRKPSVSTLTAQTGYKFTIV